MRLAAVLAIVTGVLLGLGLYTFEYAEGGSYFSNRPEACANCHIMREHLDSWRKSSHHPVAVCNDCHTPHEPVPKLITKAENGFRHSLMFTLQNFREPLRITRRNAERLQHNCLGCHGGFVSEVLHPAGPHAEEELRCVRCHSDVGHGPRR
jgi:cytochrome c nitrite reductase small subunit